MNRLSPCVAAHVEGSPEGGFIALQVAVSEWATATRGLRLPAVVVRPREKLKGVGVNATGAGVRSGRRPQEKAIRTAFCRACTSGT